ncbi:OTU domain-containing protein 5 [Zootermopsis nevadensis]|uniref:OTU domain-containing protein 5 n=1 Tax=Zootermopsis nevadensis TaxID=136037 RepID=UPI000B8E37EE|nr:OTU domain-containing protein 5 [Zootermopsis nevadensis]
MTILAKKKVNQGKPEESSDSSAHHGGSHSRTLAMGSMPNHSQGTETKGHSSPCWSSGEKRASHCSSSHFDDYEPHESGPSQSKRRHRASPHRTTRSKLRERNAASPTFPGSSPVAGSSPTAGPSGLVDELVNASGYNSGDEYGPCESADISEAEWVERDRWFEKSIRRKGFIIKQMEQDGACLFRAVADQVYGDQEMHATVRSHCMDYIAANGDYFSQYVTEDFDTYVDRKRHEYVHGNHIEMQAMSEMYNRTVEVFCYGTDPINIFLGKHKNDNEPIRLSYQRGSHYNSIVDPYKATVGVGLGLPSYTPGLAEKNLMKEAVNQSEHFQVEQAMLEDKLRATDWEATNEAIEEQVARESYLQWLRDNEQRNKNMQRSTTATSSTATVTSDSNRSSPRTRVGGVNSPSHPESHRNSPKVVDTKRFSDDATACSSSAGCSWDEMPNSRQGFDILETASFLNHFSPELFGLKEWEDGILAQVIARSQQEYIDRLKKNRDNNENSDSVSSNGSSNGDIEGPSTSR